MYRSEDLLRAASNRYHITVLVANRAKRRRYEDLDSIDDYADYNNSNSKDNNNDNNKNKNGNTITISTTTTTSTFTTTS